MSKTNTVIMINSRDIKEIIREHLYTKGYDVNIEDIQFNVVTICKGTGECQQYLTEFNGYTINIKE